MRWIRHAAPLITTVSISCAHGLAAQHRESEDAHLRNDCRLAAQILTTGQPHPRYEWARDIVSECDASGGPALAAFWQAVSADTSNLKHVVYTTSRLRDARILRALVLVAEDGGRPLEVRLSSLRVLTSYFKPSAYVTLRDLQHPSFGSPLGWVTEFHAIDGTEPLPPDTRNTILELVRRLAVEDSNATMQGAARFLKEAFESELRTGG
jgi:hypothetical protein